MKPIVEHSIVAFIFGGSIGIFGGLLIFINEQNNETHRIVTRMQIIQQTDRKILIDELATIKTEIHKQHGEDKPKAPEETLRDLDLEKTKIQNKFNPWEQRR
jgi:hypothetical protein